MPLPPNRRDPKDASLPKSESDREKLAEAVAEMRDSNASFEDTARTFELDPELLRRWARDNRRTDRQQNSTAPSQPPSDSTNPDVAEHDHDAYSDNWDRATEGVDKVEVLSHFETALNTFPPLRLLLGTDRRRVLTAITFGLATITAIIGLAKPQTAPTPTLAPPPTSPNDTLQLPETEELESAANVARAFLGAEGWAAKRTFVESPEHIDTIAAEWYSRPENAHLTRAAKAIKLLDVVGTIDQKQRYSFVLTNSSFGQLLLITKLSDDGQPKVLWKQTVHYSSTSWDHFAATRDTKPATFFVRNSLNDYFNAPFDDASTFASYRLLSAHENGETLFGFVRHDSEVADQLQLLSLGYQQRNIVLELRHPKSGAKNCVEILSIISENWIRDQ